MVLMQGSDAFLYKLIFAAFSFERDEAYFYKTNKGWCMNRLKVFVSLEQVLGETTAGTPTLLMYKKLRRSG